MGLPCFVTGSQHSQGLLHASSLPARDMALQQSKTKESQLFFGDLISLPQCVFESQHGLCPGGVLAGTHTPTGTQ